MNRIPSKPSRKWSVAHSQDIAGDIGNTRAMNFDKSGYAKLASLPIALYTSLQNANVGLLLSIVSDGSTYYFITSAGAWTSSDGATVTQITTTNQPTFSLQSDAVMFNGELVVSGTTMVKSYASGTWTDRITGLSLSYPHPLCVFESRNEVTVGNGNVVTSYNTSYSLQNTLTIPIEYIVTWGKWRQNKQYMGTRNISGAGAKMFIWSGTGSSAQEAYPVQADWIYAGAEYQSSIAVVTSAGQLLRFNGGGFDILDHFPVYETQFSWTTSSSPASAVGKVASRGMIAHGTVLYINIDGSVHRNGTDYPGNYLHEQPSGLWEFDPDVGLYHKAGYVYTRYASLTPSGVSSNELSFSADHMCETGDPVFAKTVSGLTGITQSQTYFAIKTSESTLKLAFSPAAAYAGNALTLGGAVSGDVIACNVYNSLGAVADTTPGAVAVFTNVSFYDFYGLEVLFGGRCQNAAGTVVSSIMSLGLGRNVGMLTLAPIYSGNVTETFQKILQFIRDLNLDTDSVLIKYRTEKRFGLPTPAYTNISGKATWVSADSFTIQTLYKDVISAVAGDEVTILTGTGAGRTAHITDVSNVGTLYTFTIDETIPNVTPGDLSEVVMDNWTKLTPAITNAQATLAEGYSEVGAGLTSSWVQFRLELRGSKYFSIALMQIISQVSKQSV